MENKSTEVIEFIGEYFQNYFVERNFEKIKEMFSDNLTVIGTGIHEYGYNPELSFQLYKEDLAHISDPVVFKNLKLQTSYGESGIAIVNCTFNIEQNLPIGKLSILSIRGSFVLEQSEDCWKILHVHMSMPYKDQEEGESYPIQNLRKQYALLEEMVAERTKELKQANELLTLSNNAKDKLFSIIAHDLKSPFNALLGFTDLLENEYDTFDDIERKRVIESMHKSTRKVYSLTENLLIWARTQSKSLKFKPQQVDLNKIIESSIEQLEGVADKKNITIQNQIPKLLMGNADHFMISTVLRNLISNAIKFTPEHGQIKVCADNLNLATNQLVKICIEDNGTGIPTDILSDLFDVGKSISRPGTNNESGTGLGLAICKEFIAYHGTDIWAENLPDKGSKFSFTLKT